ncbi:MAG: MFS transporter [Spirochaetes bacterium]|nr:MFS transporter [Spirochaetota bacterium]
MTAKGLSLRLKLGFGICDLGGNLFFTILGFYVMNFVTDVALLGAALAGTALMIGKIWDAVIDPAIGLLSDRTRRRMGRRRPWMLGGAIGTVLMMTVMFTNPHIVSQPMLFLWVLAVYCLLVTANSCVAIAYGALTPEMTRDYDDRTVLNAFRMSFAVIGTLLGAGLVLPIVGAFPDANLGWTAMGAAMGAVMAATALITVVAVREPAHAAAPPTARENVWSTWAATLKNRPFVLVVVSFACHVAGVSIVQGTLIYYFKYVFGGSGSFIVAMLCLLVPSLLFIPVWTVVSKRIGKKWTYNLGMGVVAAAVMVIFFFAADLGPVFMYAVMAVAGVGFATHYVMPNSLVPDTTDLDYAEHGIRREGAFYGIWNFTTQAGQAFANALIGWILAGFGYVANVEQGPLARLGIRILVGPAAALFIVAGIVALSFYPISRTYYEKEIAPRVAARDEGTEVTGAAPPG